MSNGATTVDDSEILRIFALSPDPVLSAPEIAKQLPISNQAVNKRLNTMQDAEIIESKTVGSSAKVYWLTEAGRAKLADAEFD